MTSAQIKHFAKLNGLTLHQAREQLLQQAAETLSQFHLKNQKHFEWVTTDLRTEVNYNGAMADYIALPSGLSNEVEGVLNIQVFEPNQQIPKFALNTAMCAAYVTARAVYGNNKRQEYFAIIGKDTGYQAIIGCVAKQQPSAAWFSMYIPYALATLPEHIRDFIYNHLRAADTSMEISCCAADETHWQRVGIVPVNV